MGYSPRPPAVKGPQKGKRSENIQRKAYENQLSREIGAPKIYWPKAPKTPHPALAPLHSSSKRSQLMIKLYNFSSVKRIDKNISLVYSETLIE